MRGIMLFVALAFLWMPAVAGGRTEVLLDSLDRAVARKSVFVAAKSARIDQLKGQPARTLADKYSLSKFLFNEYKIIIIFFIYIKCACSFIFSSNYNKLFS